MSLQAFVAGLHSIGLGVSGGTLWQAAQFPMVLAAQPADIQPIFALVRVMVRFGFGVAADFARLALQLPVLDGVVDSVLRPAFLAITLLPAYRVPDSLLFVLLVVAAFAGLSCWRSPILPVLQADFHSVCLAILAAPRSRTRLAMGAVTITRLGFSVIVGQGFRLPALGAGLGRLFTHRNQAFRCHAGDATTSPGSSISRLQYSMAGGSL